MRSEIANFSINAMEREVHTLFGQFDFQQTVYTLECIPKMAQK